MMRNLMTANLVPVDNWMTLTLGGSCEQSDNSNFGSSGHLGDSNFGPDEQRSPNRQPGDGNFGPDRQTGDGNFVSMNNQMTVT
jgi:hypothetical protein